MARLKKHQLPELISGKYAAIPWIVIDSDSFKGASDKAKSLLYALMRQHNGKNNGHLHLARKWLQSQGWTCDESNRKAVKELIERGLIIQTKWGGLNMGPNLYALTWHIISNYIGLEINAKGYPYKAYHLCTLPPTARRKPPSTKKNGHLDDRDSTASLSETADFLTGSTAEHIERTFSPLTASTIENNVVIPLPRNKKQKRIVGVKGKSGIRKQNSEQDLTNELAA